VTVPPHVIMQYAIENMKYKISSYTLVRNMMVLKQNM